MEQVTKKSSLVKNRQSGRIAIHFLTLRGVDARDIASWVALVLFQSYSSARTLGAHPPRATHAFVMCEK